MAETFRNKPIAIRQAIFYEFLKGAPVFKAYQEFCKTLGDDFLIYPDFEYWFMRFSKGKFNLNYNRYWDMKCRTFTELPDDVFEGIASFLSSEERYNLRFLSKNIQKIVDSWKPDVVRMCFDHKMLDGKRQNYARLLRHPKLELDHLRVHYRDIQSAKMVESVLKEVTHQVRVKSFVMGPEMSEICAIISKLHPNTLKKVDVYVMKNKSVAKMRKFLKLKQIKGLDSLAVSTNLKPSEFPFKCFYNYPNFDIRFHDTDELSLLAPFVKKLVKKDTKFRRCRITFHYLQHAESFFTNAFSKLGTPVRTLKNTRHIPIPGTDDAYKVKFSNHSITIVRRGKDDDSDPDPPPYSYSIPNRFSDSESDPYSDSESLPDSIHDYSASASDSELE